MPGQLCRGRIHVHGLLWRGIHLHRFLRRGIHLHRLHMGGGHRAGPGMMETGSFPPPPFDGYGGHPPPLRFWGPQLLLPLKSSLHSSRPRFVLDMAATCPALSEVSESGGAAATKVTAVTWGRFQNGTCAAGSGVPHRMRRGLEGRARHGSYKALPVSSGQPFSPASKRAQRAGPEKRALGLLHPPPPFIRESPLWAGHPHGIIETTTYYFASTARLLY